AAARGVPDMDGVLEPEVVCDRSQVGGVMVHIVPAVHLGGAAVAAPVVSDHPVAAIAEEQHLGVPIVGRERPTVAEHNGIAVAPILVEDLDPVLGLDGGHAEHPFQRLVTARLSALARRAAAGFSITARAAERY